MLVGLGLRMSPVVTRRTDRQVSWEESVGGKENEKCSPLSSYKINVNVPNVVEVRKSIGALYFFFFFFFKKGSKQTWLQFRNSR